MSLIFQVSKPMRQRGAAAVEFAIVISLLALIAGGIIEFGRVLWYLDALTKATRDGARYLSAAPKPLSVTDTTVRGMVEDAATKAGLPGFVGSNNVAISCQTCPAPNYVCQTDTNCTAPDYVTVAITSYSVAFGSWFAIPLPSGPWALTPHTTMRYTCAAGATPPC